MKRDKKIGVNTGLIKCEQADDKIRQSGENPRTYLESAPDGVYLSDLKGTFLYGNKKAEEITGYKREVLIGSSFLKLNILPSVYLAKAAKLLALNLLGMSTGPDEFEINRADNSRVWVEINTAPVKERGKVVVIGFVRDITERKNAEHAIDLTNTILKTQQETSLDGILVVDEHGTIISFNKRFIEIWGIPSDIAESRSDERALNSVLDKLVDPAGFLMQVKYLYAHKEDKSHDEILLKDGRALDRYSAPMYGTNGYYYGRVWYFRDITERKEIEKGLEKASKELMELATHDALTGLPNRRLLYDRFDIALANARRKKRGLAVMSLDLDRFKVINDTLGHDVGDRLLVAAAGRLASNLRKVDTVARVGGDEFVLLLWDIDRKEDAGKVAQKIVEEFRRPFLIDGHTLNNTVSVGVAIFPEDGKDIKSLLKNSDDSLYRVKESGRNNYQFVS